MVAPRRLETWKVIASFIGRSVTWTRQQASAEVPADQRLPVYFLGRAGDARRGTPCADPAALLAWEARMADQFSNVAEESAPATSAPASRIAGR